MKPIDVWSSSYIDFDFKSNEKDPIKYHNTKIFLELGISLKKFCN